MNSNDNEFYNSAAAYIKQLEKGSGIAERRRPQRHSMLAYHRIAAYHERIPEPSEFSPVLCHDLSTGGFSFFVEVIPTNKMLVVAFDHPDRVTYLKARIAHSENVRLYQSGHVEYIGEKASHTRLYPTGAFKSMILVGCEFLERIESATLLSNSSQLVAPIETSPDLANAIEAKVVAPAEISGVKNIESLLAAQKSFYDELLNHFQNEGQDEWAQAVLAQMKVIEAAIQEKDCIVKNG